MDYKEKYEEALSRARKLYHAAKVLEYEQDIKNYEEIFPELAEPEDEKIRKTLIEIFSGVGKKDWRDIPTEKIIAWLEKQKDINSKEYVFRPLAGCDITTAAIQAIEQQKLGNKVVLAFNGAYIPVEEKKVVDILNEYHSWLEKQNEQASVHMVEPKFKVGDIIINIHYRWDGSGRIKEIKDGSGRIKEIKDDKYIFDDGSYITIKEQDNWELVDKNKPKFKVGDWR